MYRYMKLFGFVVFFLFLGIVQVSRPVWGSKWSRTGNLNQDRVGYTGALFTDGKFMIVGCYNCTDTNYDVFDPATGTWTLDLLPIVGGHHPMAILLPSGEVLYATNTSLSYYLYNQVTGWSPSLVGTVWGSYCCATLLKDGDVLLMYNGQDCVLYDHATDGLTPTTGSLNKDRQFGVELLLPDDKVLVSGRIGIGDNTSELYDPVAKTWTYTTGNLAEGRYGHVGVLLPPPWEQVLVAGNSGFGPILCELYDPGSQSWSTTGSLTFDERYKAAMVLLPSGKALMVGGEGTTIGKTCELYDPDATSWTREDDLEFTRKGHVNAVVLQTGKVLVSGGQDNEDRAEIYDPSEGVWTGKPDLNVERGAHTVTLLPIIPSENCSTTVLIVGGKNDGGILDLCELYNYTDEKTTITDTLVEARAYHTATLLFSGQVLVAGGEGSGGTAISSSEIYTIGKPGSWASAGDMGEARFDHTATLLDNGDVLVTGGENGGANLNTCKIYNGGWNPAPIMGTPRARHTAVMLLNGDILVIGGQTAGGTPTATCELWNGAGWAGKANMSIARYWHTATVLQSGKVLVAGGRDAGGASLSSCEIYDPDLDSWSPEGPLNQARYQHNTTLLYSGLVLVAGGKGGGSSCEIWDPAAEWDETTDIHKWKTTGSLIQGRTYHSSVLIPDSMPFILAIGGTGGGNWLNSIEEYDVGLGYRKIWQSEITSHSAVTQISPSMHISGTLFRGVSEADGGNYCHIVNSDHPIMSFIRVGGGNWQGNGGGGVMYIPRSTSWSDTHTVVSLSAMPQGYYTLWAITNGIPTNWYKLCPAGTEEKTGTKHKATGISVAVYPNPAIRESHIVFSISHNDSRFTIHDLRLTIHDISGRLVRSLTITDNRTPNTEVTWNRKDSENRKVKSGIYFYRLSCKDLEIKGKFVILK